MLCVGMALSHGSCPGTLLWAWLDEVAAAQGGYAPLVYRAGLDQGVAERLVERQVPQPITLGRLLCYAGVGVEEAQQLRLDAHLARGATRWAHRQVRLAGV